MINDLSLSIIMPALNEEKNIKEAIFSSISALKKNNITGEIIVVNDGSSDSTRQIVEDIGKENPLIRLINHDTPKGIGYSFFDGVKNSKNDVVVFFPGDNENDPDDALAFYVLMEKVDIIIPFIHNVEIRDRIRRVISSLYRFIINLSFGTNINYTNGTVFYRRSILEGLELKSEGFFYQAELLVKLIRKGYMFAEIPNFLSVRRDGKSKATTFNSFICVMKNYLRLFFDIHIRRIETVKGYKTLYPDSITFRKYSNGRKKIV